MRSINTSVVARICLFAMIILLLFSPHLSGKTHDYKEDFSTKRYCDRFNTTALWDTVAGELKLHPFEYTLAGSYDTPENAFDVAISGDYAYVADRGGGLQVIDISDPTSPSYSGSCIPLPDDVNGVAISGDYAFVANSNAGFAVVDISDPAAPALAGSFNTYGTSWGVAVSGDYAYVADGGNGLSVIDISDPTSPWRPAGYSTADVALGVAVSGNYAYVAAYNSGLQVIDISDPTSPTLAGSYNTSGSSWGVAVSGNHAYVADYGSGMLVIDISDPTSPSYVGSYNTPGYAYDVAISGDRAYVADYGSGLQVIDISDPAAPSYAGEYNTSGYAWGLAISGDHAFVADDGSGLQVICISNPIPPSYAGSYYTGDYARDLAISGDYAYVAFDDNENSYMAVVDISDPISPSQVGSSPTTWDAYSVAVSGDYAYVAADLDGFFMKDISNPASPISLGNIGSNESVRCIAVSGDYAYVAEHNGGLAAIDISNPAAPVYVGRYNTPGAADGVTVSGDYAYVADYDYGLRVIDISDPTALSSVGHYDTPGYAVAVSVSGNYAYVAEACCGLQVIDISDPTAPSFAGSYYAPAYSRDIAISGDYAFVAGDYDGLYVLDISDPTSPSLLGSYDTPGSALGVAVEGNYAYVADGYGGLQVIRVFQSEFDTDNNVGWSLAVDSSNDSILRASLQTTHSDSIAWELSADGGTNWMEIAPDGAWNELAATGAELLWRSTHVWAPGQDPLVSHLEINWLYQAACIDSIVDVPDDQGGWIDAYFTRSGLDFPDESSHPIVEYRVWQRAGGPAPAQATSISSFPPGSWEAIDTLAAAQQDTYSTRVSTTADSSGTGTNYTVLLITAHTVTPEIWYESTPDSGYSLDNIAPGNPTGLAVTYNTGSGTQLAWDACSDADFECFHVYRGESEDFETSPGNLVHSTSSTLWLDTVDEGWRYFYKIAALDSAGNESDAAGPETITGDDVPAQLETFALYQNVPNPFNPTTVIRFDLPRAVHVNLCIYNVKGELVTTLVDQHMAEGRKEIAWTAKSDLGIDVGSGVYFYRLVAGDYVQTLKMVLLR